MMAFTYDAALTKFAGRVEECLAQTGIPATHLVAAVGVVARDALPALGEPKRLLLVQRCVSDYDGGRWEMPGGSVDAGETVLEAAAREMKEETGLTVSRFVRDFDAIRFTTGRGEEKREWAKFSFLAEVAEQEKSQAERAIADIDLHIKLDAAEHSAWIWASSDEIQQGVAHDGTLLPFVNGEQKAIMLAALGDELHRKVQ